MTKGLAGRPYILRTCTGLHNSKYENGLINNFLYAALIVIRKAGLCYDSRKSHRVVFILEMLMQDKKQFIMYNNSIKTIGQS